MRATCGAEVLALPRCGRDEGCLCGVRAAEGSLSAMRLLTMPHSWLLITGGAVGSANALPETISPLRCALSAVDRDAVACRDRNTQGLAGPVAPELSALTAVTYLYAERPRSP